MNRSQTATEYKVNKMVGGFNWEAFFLAGFGAFVVLYMMFHVGRYYEKQWQIDNRIVSPVPCE